MPTPEHTQRLIEAASARWHDIAAFAWQSYRLSGRGAVLVLAEDLLAAGETQQPPPMNYFARDDVPPGDDFRSLMDTVDPARQVMLLVGLGDGSEQVLMMEASGDDRPRPESFEQPTDQYR